MRKLLLFCVLSVLFIGQAFAQKTVSGKVTDSETGEALPAVSIGVKGTTTGTVTDFDGNYRLSVPENGILVFSFVGFQSQEVEIGNQTTINISLAGDNKVLTEVVVVGYGEQTKADLTGSIAQVGAKQIKDLPITSVESGLQGRAAGVYINSGSGKLGEGMQIRVRGSSSVSAGTQPLFVVDGIIITSQSSTSSSSNPLADISPSDIESIEILKDASASAIYGARASNGVVIITTKRGKTGRTSFNFNAFTGFSTPTRMKEWLNAAQYKELFAESINNSFIAPDYDYDGNGKVEGAELVDAFSFEGGLDYNSNIDQDWQKEAFQDARMTQYEFSASGGSEKTTFYVGGSYLNQTGIIKRNAFERMSGRMNIDHTVNDKMKIGANISLVNSVNFRVPGDNAFSNPLQLVALPPIQAAYEADGSVNRNTLYYNNILEATEAKNLATTWRSISNFYASYKILPSLTFRTEAGADLYNTESDEYRGKRTEDGAPTGYGYSDAFRTFNFTLNNTLSFNKTIAENQFLDILVGTSYQNSETVGTSSEGRGFPNDKFQRISSAAQIVGGSSTGTAYSFLSYFGRVNYKISNRYLLAASVRSDGSSRFGSNNRFGIFPSASIGWVVSEEAFLKDITAISFLKLRGSWGITGNAEIGNFASRALYQGTAYADQSGITAVSLPSPDLKWERTTQIDFGIDFGFLNERITGEFDFYIKNTNDLLLDLTLPSTSGYTTITRNIGALENQGFEFVLNTVNLDLANGFKWTSNFNISRNVNKVTNMQGREIIGGSRFLGRVREGYPLGVFWGVKYAGVDPQTGNAQYYLKNGEKTDDYGTASTSDNLQQVGDPNPDFIAGFTNTFTFKGFDFNFLLQAVYGNDIYNVAGFFQSVNADYFDNQTADQLNRWQKAGDVTDVPAARLYEANGGGASSRWVSDGSFLRVKTMTLGYTLPKEIIQKIYLQNVKVYMSAQNLFTFTNYNGWDPEVSTYYNNSGNGGGNANFLVGHDFYTPPQARTITFGVNVGF